MISAAFAVAGLLIGYFIGLKIGNLEDTIKDLTDRVTREEPELGATFGSYAVPNQNAQIPDNGIPVGIVEAKTPQRVEFEAEESIRREARGE